VIEDPKGNLYGTTPYGGDLSCGTGFGCGVVFKLSSTGKETVLHTFKGGTDGAAPYAGVIRDDDGNLYGTTGQGGTSENGTVFEVSETGKETVLHRFKAGADGLAPSGANLFRDAKGNLYGSTSVGGDLSCAPNEGRGCGVVFKLSKAGEETVLHSFKGEEDGQSPNGVIQDTEGNLYGTAVYAGDMSCNGGAGCGVVFKLTP